MEKITLDFIKNEFLNQLKSQKNYSKKTIESYNHDINKFYLYLKDNDINSLDMIDKNVMRMYLLKQKENNITNRTIGRYYSSLNSLFKYCIEREYIKQNPLELIDYPKYTKKVPEFVYESKIDNLLNTSITDNIQFDARNRLIVYLLLDSGIRLSELVNIKVNDIDFNDRSIKVFGKGSKERYIKFGDNTRTALSAWLLDRSTYFEDVETNALFISQWRNRLTVEGVRKLMNKYADGINGKHITAHTLRKSTATNMAKAGADLLTIASVLNHESIQTTRRYAAAIEQDKQKAINAIDDMFV